MAVIKPNPPDEGLVQSKTTESCLQTTGLLNWEPVNLDPDLIDYNFINVHSTFLFQSQTHKSHATNCKSAD